MKRFIPLFTIISFLFGQDTLNLKSGESLTGAFYGKVGYSRPMGDGEYEGGYYGSVLYEGDMFYGFGVEVYINQSTFLELMFVNYKGGTLGIDGNINKGFNLGIKHTHLSAGFGFTY
tara:strand:- start:196 stop:546 length:351 start_codon:yes stop_codon:yes gene_type:complete